MKHILKIVVFATLAICCNNFISAQSGNLKTYNGEFHMHGFGYSSEIKKVTGIATYYYRDAPDGTRIFEGDFSFECEHRYEEKMKYEVNGSFKNNKQIGKWGWRRTGYQNSIYVEEECTINFDENGVLNGAFDLWIGSDTNNRDRWMKGVFENGKIASISYKLLDYVTAEGRYNKDGEPMGKWSVTGTDVPPNYVLNYDAYGRCLDAYYIDQSTGDKKRILIRDSPDRIYMRVSGAVSRRIFRSTPEIK